jgi:hypothetical protein
MLEQVHARVRRYTSPEEQPFFPGFLPETLLLPPLDYSEILGPNDVNENNHLLERYIEFVIPAVCAVGDDEQYGSSVLCDVTALQALSRRVSPNESSVHALLGASHSFTHHHSPLICRFTLENSSQSQSSGRMGTNTGSSARQAMWPA